MSQLSAIALPNINPKPNTPIPTHHEKLQKLPTKKRKREDEAETLSDLKPFVIRPCPSSIYDKPYILHPLRLLERSRLPLSFLDPAPANSSLSATRLFSASIGALEKKDETGGTESTPSMLLIASLETEQTLFAVERVKNGIFALCKLCGWVKTGYLDDSASVAYTPISRPALAVTNANSETWWQKAAVEQEVDASKMNKPAKRPCLSMAPPAPAEKEVMAEPTKVSLVEPEPLLSEIREEPVEPEVTSQQVFETLIQQYLGALYKSKTSLAFFAKGPLSRTRTAFTTSSQEDLTIIALTTLLRSMLLTMASMDKKYREKLPGMIKEFPHTTLSDFEQEAPTSIKKRKSKKLPKLSREGVYSMEEDHVKRWWFTEDSKRQDETAEQLMRRKIGDLRVRETLAQVVLILEILALESTPEFKTMEAGRKATGEETQETQKEGDGDAKKRKPKPKKPADLILLLDLLMDKLSIWQSIENDRPTVDTQKSTDLSSRDNDDKLQDRDLLASFCVEVVIPFFKSRVPEQAALVNKKFGGPGAVSPEKYKKPKPRKPVEQVSKQKPEKKSRQGLQKTPSESYSQFKAPRPPSLARSATDLGISRFKREESEVSLFDIPVQRSNSVVARVERLKAQQVDMNAISAATEAKLAQKARLEEEVKNAINTLKKPNPRQAVKEYVEATEQRSLGSASMRKKTAGPIRKILDDKQVQVAATPRHHRKTNAFVPVTGKRERFREEEREVLPPSSGEFCIPSSSMRPVSERPSSGGALFGAQTTSKPPLFTARRHLDGESSVMATPSRGSSKMRSFPNINITANGSNSNIPTTTSKDALEDPSHINATPPRPSVKPLHFASIFPPKPFTESTIPQTPSKPKRAEKTPYAPIFATPRKPTPRSSEEAALQIPEAPKNAFAISRIASSPPKNAAVVLSRDVDADDGKDIYDALGWNDDFDDIA